MTLRAVMYSSQSVGDLSPKALDDLLVDARLHNQRHKVSGVLLYDGQRFMQYFEGPPDGMEVIHGRIIRSALHHQIRVMFDGPVEHRYFAKWYMGCRGIDDLPSVLQRLSTQEWQRMSPSLEDPDGIAPGLRAVLDFWNNGGG